ncbi:MAG: Uma2 family endonuclease [Candidatus Eremiobacteraeota bacterium]|nr:Uma2 family endonuclease [Candidatus Eremiobacteraeota bacterium]MCW5866639.1 Uma2 family endonuclease [Candidatus Eremiobacteraeota bacterium]
MSHSPYLWTREAYCQLIDQGVFLEGPNVELIEGEILILPPQGRDHICGVSFPNTVLVRLFGDTHLIRVQCDLGLGLDSQPQPDFVLSPLTDFDRADLVIEVSQTSLSFDRNRKSRLYARNGVQEYWIVNLPGEVVEVRRQPEGDRFRQVRLCRPEESVRPLFAPEVEVPLRAFFLKA